MRGAAVCRFRWGTSETCGVSLMRRQLLGQLAPLPSNRSYSSVRHGRTLENSFQRACRTLPGTTKRFFDLNAINDTRVSALPYSIRVLLESAIRNCDGTKITEKDVTTIVDWARTSQKGVEIPFKPSRVILQDFTGVPAVVDLAAMRDAFSRLGGDPRLINPLVDVDLVVDHSVQVDYSRSLKAFHKNLDMEMQRNKERFAFLKWGSKAFNNMVLIPPGTGIVHQVNLEYLARVVMDKDNTLYPDSVVGTDSHTTMINGLGVLGWGVGGIEAEAVMLGQHISMVLPEVVGVRLHGVFPRQSTATDLVLTLTEMLRKKGVVGKFVEFCGPGLGQLSLADRATVSNMAPEYGATVGFFPIDEKSLQYLRQTGRPDSKVDLIEAYAKSNLLFADHKNKEEVQFTDVIELDLGSVEPCVAGPKRPQDRVPVRKVKTDFESCLANPVGFKGYGLTEAQQKNSVDMYYRGKHYKLSNGSVCIAAITSCTNTSNPGVIFGAGLLAKNAVERGLTVAPYIVTSLSPGSKAVTEYLKMANLEKPLQDLGFFLAGYGCMTCIGNTGEFDPEVTDAITKGDLVVAAVLSGNRNFEGRTHPLTRANYLASPPLVVAYALAGRMNIDFETEPLGRGKDGKPVFLRDIWPSIEDIASLEAKCIRPEMFISAYKTITQGTQAWNDLHTSESKTLYGWDKNSTYIHNPPFFQTMQIIPTAIEDVESAFCLLKLGHSITTDHISPAGNIAKDSPAAKYLMARGVERKNFNTYGARRGNDEVMVRGTFANIRLVNQMCTSAGPKAVYVPTGEILPVFDCAEKYKASGIPTIILAGREYGSGSSRDWAAKGPYLMGVKAIIAESFERIHRSNLVGMGVLPLQYVNGQTAESLGLTGYERFSVPLHRGKLPPGGLIRVTTDSGKQFDVKCRLDTDVEVDYFNNGGILQYVLRNALTARN